METLIYKRDWDFFSGYKIFPPCKLSWKCVKRNKYKEIDWEIEVEKHIDWDWSIHSCMISHISRLVSYYDLCMLDLWFSLGYFSQININLNYDFGDSFMKLVWTLIIIFPKLF